MIFLIAQKFDYLLMNFSSIREHVTRQELLDDQIIHHRLRTIVQIGICGVVARCIRPRVAPGIDQIEHDHPLRRVGMGVGSARIDLQDERLGDLGPADGIQHIFGEQCSPGLARALHDVAFP